MKRPYQVQVTITIWGDNEEDVVEGFWNLLNGETSHQAGSLDIKVEEVK